MPAIRRYGLWRHRGVMAPGCPLLKPPPRVISLAAPTKRSLGGALNSIEPESGRPAGASCIRPIRKMQ